jgi:acyl dehydratase
VAYGHDFETFTVGEVIRRWPGRTMTETDNIWFAPLTLNQPFLHSDAHDADEPTPHGQHVVLGPLRFSMGLGMTVADVSGRAIANLEIEQIARHAPTVRGDPLDAATTLLAPCAARRRDRGVAAAKTGVHTLGRLAPLP